MRTSLICLAVSTLTLTANAQLTHAYRRVAGGCTPKTAIEFISPMPTEEIPVLHMPPPKAWHVILEVAVEQVPGQTTPVREFHSLPSPGLAVVPATDVNGDAVIGDAHPGIPGLVLKMNDDLFVNGTLLPAGTNLASFFEMIGSEIEHGGDQTTMLSWVVTPQFQIIDIDGTKTTTLTATINGQTDTVLARHGVDPKYAPCSIPSTPTVSIFAPDWISTVDSMVNPGDHNTPFFVGVEVRIPCWFNPVTVPPTPTPLDPIPGPGPGTMAFTGNFPLVAGPGGNPAFPTLDVRFSDRYFDFATGSMVPGGVITGGTCATIWGATGGNLAFAFEQSSVDSWYGVDGIPNMAPVLADDQIIYRFTMIADGAIFDTDALPNEMMITATIETECNLYSITNVRVKHRPIVTTPDPGP
jgi:hypothetical protein